MKRHTFALIGVLGILTVSSCRHHTPTEPIATPESDTIALYPHPLQSAHDATGHGHDGRALYPQSMVATRDRFGNGMGAGTDVFEVDDTTNLNFTGSSSYTISAWIQTTDTGTAYVVSKGPKSGQHQGYRLGISGGYASVFITGRNGSGDIGPNGLGYGYVADGLWHFIAASIKGPGLVSVCVDSQVYTMATNPMAPDFQNDGPLMLGGDPSGTIRFNGLFDEIVIYGHALTFAELQARFHEGGWTGQHDTTVLPDSTDSHWSAVPSGTTSDIHSIEWTGNLAGGLCAYYCGSGGVIAKSFDSGRTWKQLRSEGGLDLNSICFQDAVTGLAGGESGTLLRTTDQGATWTKMPEPFEKLDGSLESVREIRNLGGGLHPRGYNMIMVGGAGNMQTAHTQGFVMTTMDGGTFSRMTYQGSTSEWPSTLFAVSREPNAMDNVTVAGVGGQIFRTVDLGLSGWVNESLPAAENFTSIDFIDKSIGMACTLEGKIQKTTDGGMTWQMVASNLGELDAIRMVDKNDAWAAGAGGTIFHTIDGGLTWTRMTPNVTHSSVIDWKYVSIRDSRHILFAGTGGALLQYSY